MTGRTDKLEVFIQQVVTPLAPQAADSTTTVATPTPRDASGHDFSSASGPSRSNQPASARPPSVQSGSFTGPTQRFDVSGRRMQVQLVQAGRETQWRQIDIFGGARLVETQTAKPDERPLEITGEFLHAVQPQADAGQVTVTGKPAHVEGRGLSLTGDAVNLDQRANKVWMDGQGLMTLIVDRDLQGEKLSQPAPVEITWQGGMQFDGQRALFDRDVVVRQQQARLQTRTLEAVMSRRIDFAQGKQEGVRPQLDRVICRGGVFVDRSTSDGRGALAREQLQTADLTIDQVSGAIFGNGPGWLTRVYRRDGELDGPLSGGQPAPTTAPKTRGAPAAGGATPFNPPPDPDKPLNYLRVDFQQALRGNLHQRVIVFSDQVQAVHAPVRAWDDTVNPDRIELLGPRGAVLKCDELHLNEMRAGGSKWFEASAKGNTNVEGDGFTAQAAQLNYSQDKDLLVLQGTDRAQAELWRQQGIGTPRSHLRARKIEYWRRDNHIKIDKAQYLDVNDIPTDKGRSRPKPASR
jgi:hypothetical protein